MEFTDRNCREFMEQLPEAVFLESLEGEILDVNKEACSLLGYSKEELLDMEVEDLVPEGAPAFLPDEIDNATRSGEPLETANLDKEGNKIPIELRRRIIELEGEERMLVTVRDISDRKRAERKLKQSQRRLKWALEGTEAGIWDWNVQTGDVVFDERWAEIVGYTLEELQPVTIETWRGLAHPEDLKRSKELLKKHFNGKRDNYECEVRMKHKNGDWIWILDRGRVVEWNEKGKPIRMVGTHQDITERKEAEQALNDERNKLKRLHDAVDELQLQDTEEELLHTVVDVAGKILGFEMCGIMLLEEDRLVPIASSAGLDPDKTPSFKIGEGIVGKSFQQGETIWGGDANNCPEAKPTRQTFRSFISVPVGQLGILGLFSEEVGEFDEQDVELAEILAGHLQEEIKRVRLEEDLRRQSIRDPLTDLYNRRYFNETLGEEVERCKRYEKSLAFLMADVNRFKEINDRYSHQTGDEVLSEVADLLKANVRDADTVVRYGGDEFLIVMPETNGEAGNTVDRLRNKIVEWSKESDLLDFPLTLAMGVSHWNAKQGRDVEQALKEADRKMYEDKDR